MSEALRLAHELILAMRDTDEEHWDALEEAAAELRRLHAALAEPEQEPIAWVYPEGLEALKSGKPWVVYGRDGNGVHPDGVERIPLYLAPRQWQGLTRQEFLAVTQGLEDLEDCWMAIEAKLKEKNT
jgi:hypothetical protein